MANSLFFLETHEWVKVEGNIAYVGISEHAQDALGAIVFVDLPHVGEPVLQNEVFGAVESVKAASDLYAPLSGKVLEINESLLDSPELINENAVDTWLIKLEINDLSETANLLTKDAYEASL